MNICVAGWYYRPDLYRMIAMSGYAAAVVAHRTGDAGTLTVLPHQNVGLEWGAYNAYLRDVWRGDGPVLFLHDDAILPAGFFEQVEGMARDWDAAFIFRDTEEARINGCVHGRCVYMSARILDRFKPMGFWYDEENHGNLEPPQCNEGVQHFLRDLTWLNDRPEGRDLNFGYITIPDADFGYRGRVGLAGAEYRLSHFN